MRHGSSAAHIEGEEFPLVGGHGDPPLAPEGLTQAERLGARLAGEPIDAVYVSTLQRTAQTAAPLAARRGLTPKVEAGLREVHLGEWEAGLFRQKVADRDPVALEMFAQQRWDVIPGAEPGEQFSARVRGASRPHRGRACQPMRHGGRARRRDRRDPRPGHRLTTVVDRRRRQRLDLPRRGDARPVGAARSSTTPRTSTTGCSWPRAASSCCSYDPSDSSGPRFTTWPSAWSSTCGSTSSGARSASGASTNRRSPHAGVRHLRGRARRRRRRRSRGCRRRACGGPSARRAPGRRADSSRWHTAEQLARGEVGVELDDDVEVRALAAGPADRVGLVDRRHRRHRRGERSTALAQVAPAIARGSSRAPRKARVMSAVGGRARCARPTWRGAGAPAAGACAP